jgi:hypothetical protein
MAETTALRVDRKEQTQRLILGTTVICAIICFIPLFIPQKEAFVIKAVVDKVDDYLDEWGQDCYFRQASMSCLMIVIVPAIDLLIEWTEAMMRSRLSRLSKDKSVPTSNAGGVVESDVASIRMTLVERTLFVVGIVFTGGCMSFPAVFESPSIIAAYNSLTNCSTILTMMPLLMFFCRVSPTWTPLKAFVVSLCVCGCAVLSSIGSIFEDSMEILWASNVLMFVATGLFFIISLHALVVHFAGPWRSRSRSRSQRPRQTGSQRLKGAVGVGAGASVDHPMESKGILDNDIRTGVVVLHMVFMFTLLVVNCVWYYKVGAIGAQGVEAFMYIYISVATLAFIVELRMRKVEFQSALMALLDAKKSYVRYISHGESVVRQHYDTLRAVVWQSSGSLTS